MHALAPLIADPEGPAPIAWRAGAAVSRARFLAEAEVVGAALGTAAHAINLCEDRYGFMVGFAAAAARGIVTLLPSSRAPAVVAEVAAAHAQTICFDDAFVAARLAGAGTVRARDVPQIEAQSAVAIGFTSGSTGRPQPHLKRWSSFGAVSALNAGLVRERLVARGCTGAASLVATVPPQHMYGMETSVLLPLLGGMAVHAGRPLFPGDVAAALAEVPAPRVLITTPVHLRALLDSGLRFPPVALVLSATAPLDPTLAVGIECLLDTELRELFGSTETCVIAHRRTACEDAWTAYPGVTLAAGSDCTTVSMPWFAEPTALQDVVEVQADGRFVLRGRNADLIEIAGKRASLAELTRRVLALPGVRDAVVFQPDGEGAVRRVAALVVAPGCTAEELAAQLRGMIDSAFMPRPLLCVAELPRNEVGKLARAKLLAALQTATAPG